MPGQERPLGHPDQFPTDGLTLEEDNQLTDLLKKWMGGKISTPVFAELARMIPQPIVEVVVFRQSGDTLETLLIPRPEDDIVWPGMVHTLGAAIRRSDYFREDQNPLNGVFERIQGGELNTKFEYTPVFAGRLHRLGDRGPEVAEVYIAEVPEGSDKPHHIWYPVDRLAENPKFIAHQLPHVLLAAEEYKKRLG